MIRTLDDLISKLHLIRTEIGTGEGLVMALDVNAQYPMEIAEIKIDRHGDESAPPTVWVKVEEE